MFRNKFFIVGCPRSGTTLLQQALNRHSHIAIPPETGFFSCLRSSRRVQHEHLQRVNEDLEIAQLLPAKRLRQPAEARAYYEEMARLYLEQLDKPGVTHFGEKTPAHLNHLDGIRRVFPEARIILIHRDGRDVALSLRRLPWTSRDLYVNFALWLYCCRLQRAAQRSCGLPLLCVRYEDLVTNPETELRKILAFLELPYEPWVAEGKGNAAGVPDWEEPWKARAIEKINCERLDLWRTELSHEEIGILECWGGWALRDLGYELTTAQDYPLPRFFRLRVACKSLWWLARRPRYGQQKALWLGRQATPADPRRDPAYLYGAFRAGSRREDDARVTEGSGSWH